MPYLGHTDGTAEASADTAIDTLGLSPAGTDAVEPVTLVTVERSLVCTSPVNYASSMPFPASMIKGGLDSVAFSILLQFYQISNCTSNFSSFENLSFVGCVVFEGSRKSRIEGKMRSGDRISTRGELLFYSGSRRTLLDDGDVLLGGDHLEKQLY